MARKAISFKLVGGDANGLGASLEISEDTLTYEPFRELYEADKSINKVFSLMDLKYVKLMGEEEGAFSQLDGHEKNKAVTEEAYGVVNPQLSKERRALRDRALNAFRAYEETEEGQVLEMINSRIQVLRRSMMATQKDVADLKDDKLVATYLEQSAAMTKNLLTLINEKNKVIEAIAKQGGRKSIKNKAGAASSLNEEGAFSRENIMKRRKQRENVAASA